MRELSELRISIDKKADRKELNEFKNQIGKELTQKISMFQTEKIVKKFQEEIFTKINNNVSELQRVEYNLKKNINDQLLLLKKDYSEALKIKETRNAVTKLEKKLKKYSEQAK